MLCHDNERSEENRKERERVPVSTVPWSIRSSFVMTPMVRMPDGSTSLASLRASELAKSWFAGDTARMMQFSLVMNCKQVAQCHNVNID